MCGAAVATALSSALCAASASAQTLVALVDGNSLALIDGTTGKLLSAVPLSGSGDLVGIDVRPADGQLYGVTPAGAVVTVDPQSGQTTPKSQLDAPLPQGVALIIEIDPVADDLRVMGQDGSNMHANVDSGKVTQDSALNFASGGPHAGTKPNVVAGAYSNSTKGAQNTMLYPIDSTNGELERAPTPNDGRLNSIGQLGPGTITSGGPVAFDIGSDASGNNTGYMVSGNKLQQVDLATGHASGGQTIEVPGVILDIAVLPAR